MSKNHDQPYSWPVTEERKKDIDAITALLELDHDGMALGLAVNLALRFARAHAKGNTTVIFSTPRVAAMIKSNPEFIKALCEEGVVEWLTPFVLAKSKQGGQPTPDTAQP